jgi:hypothetical protein
MTSSPPFYGGEDVNLIILDNKLVIIKLKMDTPLIRGVSDNF